MDIIKKPKNKLYQFHQYQRWLIGGGVLLVLIVIHQLMGSENRTINRSDILLEKVEQGSLHLVVNGYGKLKSKHYKVLTSRTQSVVKEIHLRPGAEVKVDSPIVQLENHELEQALFSARRKLAEAKAEYRQTNVTLERERLIEQSRLVDLESNYESARLRAEAEESLKVRGAVSTLDHKQSVLMEKNLNKQLTFAQKNYAALSGLHRESLSIMEEKVKMNEDLVVSLEQQVNALTVTSGIDGVLQSLSVEPGQSLSAGQSIGFVGSTNDLLASIKIPQGQAHSVQVGNAVVVDTRLNKIKGSVYRINPIVTENTVEIEVELEAGTATNARAQMNVEATITTGKAENVFHVKKPANVSANSEHQVFVLNPGSDLATRRTINFGQEADSTIEILSGAKAGDILVISDVSAYKEYAALEILN